MLVTTATIGSGLLFGAGVLLSLEDTKFWPILAILSPIYTLLGVYFTSPNNVMVYQNWQI